MSLRARSCASLPQQTMLQRDALRCRAGQAALVRAGALRGRTSGGGSCARRGSRGLRCCAARNCWQRRREDCDDQGEPCSAERDQRRRRHCDSGPSDRDEHCGAVEERCWRGPAASSCPPRPWPDHARWVHDDDHQDHPRQAIWGTEGRECSVRCHERDRSREPDDAQNKPEACRRYDLLIHRDQYPSSDGLLTAPDDDRVGRPCGDDLLQGDALAGAVGVVRDIDDDASTNAASPRGRTTRCSDDCRHRRE